MTEPRELTENEKNEAELLEFMAKMDVFIKRESEDCFDCGKHVARLRKVGRCVYAEPCGCRLWQGTIPKVWESK